MIADEGLSVGDSLPTERELSDRFGVARNTVREAVGMLQAYGVVDVRPKVGAVLVNRPLQAALDAFSFQLAITAETFRDIQGFRALVETGLFDLLDGRIGAGEWGELDRLTDEMNDAPSVAGSAAADHAFHLRLIELAGNDTLRNVFGIMEPVILRLMETGKETRGRDLAVESHRRIVEALRRRDGLAYRYFMTDHLQQGRAFLDASGPGAATRSEGGKFISATNFT